MRVVWLEQADMALSLIADYIASEYGEKAKDKFMCKVDEVGVLLADNPYLGPVEPLLADLPSGYRSIVVAKLNKIIYRIVDNRIEIADFWDCRREPDTLSGQLK